MPADQIRIFIIFLMNYPIGWFIYFCVQGPLFRHMFVITLGIIIQMYLYGWEITHVLFMGYGGYAMMNLLDREKS
jgi:hypothetical protein